MLPEFYMREVLHHAETAMEKGEFPIAALITLDNKIIAQAATAEKRQQRFLVHAEYTVLEQADRQRLTFEERRRAVLYTNLEPCLMCLGAAMSFFLGKLYYALESPSDGAVDLVKGWERNENAFAEYRLPEIEAGLLRKESIRLFQKYVEKQPPSAMRDWAESLASL